MEYNMHIPNNNSIFFQSIFQRMKILWLTFWASTSTKIKFAVKNVGAYYRHYNIMFMRQCVNKYIYQTNTKNVRYLQKPTGMLNVCVVLNFSSSSYVCFVLLKYTNRVRTLPMLLRYIYIYVWKSMGCCCRNEP